MAEAATADILSLSEQYLLKKEEKPDVVSKPAVEPEAESPPVSEAVEVTTPITEETPVVNGEEADSAATPDDNESSGSTAEDSNASAEQQQSRDEEVEETPEIKLETAPADFRFPTSNQTRHCFTRYIEYHRCVAAKGDGASECDKFAKYYRTLCPGEWIERWNEQREDGTFPGPL